MKVTLRLLSLLVPFLLLLAEVSAQPFCDNPIKGAFVLADEDVCVGKTVHVKNQKHGGESIEYVFKFDKNQTDFPAVSQRTFDSSFVYTEAGPYTILQWGSKGEGFVLCKDIKVRETAKPNGFLTTCNNGRVRLTLVDDVIYRAYDKIEIDWGDGQIIKVDRGGLLIHDKILAAKPSITIRGIHNGDFCTSEVKSRTLTGEATPPSLASIKIKRVEMGANGNAVVVYQGMAGIQTELFIADENGSYKTTGKVSDDTGGEKQETITGLDPQKVYNFKLVSKDICDNPIESPIVSSMVLRKGTLVVDESNNMVWNAYPDAASLLQYQVLREEGPDFGNEVSVYSGIDKTDHLDPQLKCGVSYSYKLIAIVDGARSYSAPLILEPAFPAPGIIRLAQVSVESDDQISTVVSLTGVDGLTTLSNLVVERASAGSNDFQKITPDDNTDLSFMDVGLNAAQTSYCYRFSWENSCKQASPPSDVICSVLLTNHVQDISWTTQSPFTSAIDSYELVRMDDAGNIEDEMPKQLENRHAIDLDRDGNSTFKVKAQSGNMVSYSNVIGLSGELIVWAPDIFTPNGDSHNDVFTVKSYFADSFRLLIYNRWGEVMFKSENTTDGWNGTVDGKPAAPGHYIYKVEGNNIKSGSFSQTGSFMLVR
jgi:gliding motility-associated-like protein